MDLTLPPLPYEKAALAPFINARTVDIHYERHHRAYLEKLLNAVGQEAANRSLEDIIRSSKGEVFNNAAQVWNHTFYWNSLRKGGGGQPTGELGETLRQAFGSYADFKQKLAEAAVKEFGSGWAWLYLQNGQIKINSTTDAHTPIEDDSCVPLLTIDVWEHAYYLDYQQERPKYVEAVLDHLLNWDFAALNFERARRATAA
jgi:Fe-Mn family superoxide dismutase